MSKKINRKELKLTNETRALIKDLEMQIDYLVGYSPNGLHWKQEFSLRENLINSMLTDETTPPEIVDKILRVQDKLWKLKKSEILDQPYFTNEQLLREQKELEQQGIIFYGTEEMKETKDEAARFTENNHNIDTSLVSAPRGQIMPKELGNLLYRQNILFSKATSNAIDWGDMFGDPHEAGEKPSGWEVEKFLDKASKEEWLSIQSELEKIRGTDFPIDNI